MIRSILLMFTIILYGAAKGQKLPAVQQGGTIAPKNIKVDGKADEWNNQFNAYNKVNGIFYTVANNDDNLYLVIKAVDASAINKIIGGGITFSINKSSRKDVKDAVSITFPLHDTKENQHFINLT